MDRHQTTPCIHRWLLGEPHRGTIEGTCRRCGARRTYPSGLEMPEAPLNAEEPDSSLPVLAIASSPTEEEALV